MNVTQVLAPAGYYGAERWVVTLGRHLRENGVRCDLLLLGDRPEQTDRFERAWSELSLPVRLLPEDFRFDPRTVISVVRHVRRERVDLLHSHGYKSDIVSLLASRIAGVPLVITPHGFAPDAGGRLSLYTRLGLLAARFAEAVVPLSSELLERMRSEGVDERKLSLIPNAVDLLAIDEELAAHAPNPRNSRFRVIGVGRLVEGKRPMDLITLAGSMRDKNVPVELDIVGEGPERAALEAAIEAGNLSSIVNLRGFREDRLQLVADADLFVLPSASEGTPRSMMEAMALGTPVLAYDIPGVRTLIEDGVTGTVVPDGDVAALASACHGLLSDPKHALAMASEARHQIRTAFSGTRLAADYSDLYRSLISS